MLSRTSSFVGQVNVFAMEEKGWTEEFAPECAPVPPTKTPGLIDDTLHSIMCSDFACCGLTLPDLHRLLEHLEDAHVIAFDAEGRRVHPIDEQHPHGRGRAVKAVVRDYPQPDPRPPNVQTSTAPDPRVAPVMLDVWPMQPEPEELPSSPWNASVSASPPADEVGPCVTPKLLVESLEPAPENDAAAQADEGHVVGRTRSPPKRLRYKGAPYPCPIKGCTKTYKNAGGLKYHQEKGTCVFGPSSPAADDH